MSGNECRPTFPGGCTQLDTLSDIEKRLTGVDLRLSLVEQNQANMASMWARSEQRIFDVVAELRSVMMERFGELEHVLKDNGQLGLVSRVAKLENWRAADEARRDEETTTSDRMWSRVSPFFPALGYILLAAAAYYIGTIVHGGKP